MRRLRGITNWREFVRSEAHLDDAVAREGEVEALARMGTAAEIASGWNDLGWNDLQQRKRRRTRWVAAFVSLSVACAG